jgi:hypothetical protein
MSLSLTIEVDPQYVTDFPMLAAVEVANDDDGSWYSHLAFIDPAAPVGPLVLDVSPPLGPSSRIPDDDRARHTEAVGLTLDPHERLRFHVDLGCWARFPPGVYRLQVIYMSPTTTVVSAPVSFTVVAPSPAERAVAEALLGARVGERDAWARFMEDRVAPPEVRGVSPLVERALAPTLAWHRAVHGPTPVAELDPGHLPSAADGPVAAELAAMRYEILAARNDAGTARVRAAVLATWPGLSWRLDEVDAHDGPLQSARQQHEHRSTSPYEPD